MKEREFDLSFNLQNIKTTKTREEITEDIKKLVDFLSGIFDISVNNDILNISCFDYNDDISNLPSLTLKNINSVLAKSDDKLAYENWHYICSNFKLSEGILRKFSDYINWVDIAYLKKNGVYKFSKKFLKEFNHLLSNPQLNCCYLWPNDIDKLLNEPMVKNEEKIEDWFDHSNKPSATSDYLDKYKKWLDSEDIVPVDPKDPVIRKMMKLSGIDVDNLPDGIKVFGQKVNLNSNEPIGEPPIGAICGNDNRAEKYTSDIEDVPSTEEELYNMPIENMNQIKKLFGVPLSEMDLRSYKEAMCNLNFTPEFVMKHEYYINFSMLMRNPHLSEMLKNDKFFDKYIKKLAKYKQNDGMLFKNIGENKVERGHFMHIKRK